MRSVQVTGLHTGWIVLQRLTAERETVVAGQIADELNVATAWVSTLLCRLERMGLAVGANGQGGHVDWQVA